MVRRIYDLLKLKELLQIKSQILSSPYYHPLGYWNLEKLHNINNLMVNSFSNDYMSLLQYDHQKLDSSIQLSIFQQIETLFLNMMKPARFSFFFQNHSIFFFSKKLNKKFIIRISLFQDPLLCFTSSTWNTALKKKKNDISFLNLIVFQDPRIFALNFQDLGLSQVILLFFFSFFFQSFLLVFSFYSFNHKNSNYIISN